MDYRILGPLEVLDDQGRPVPLGGQREQVLLAALALEANRVVSSDRLIEAVWGDDPPKTAVNALQVHVSKLRRRLAARSDSGETVEMAPPGYVLRAGPGAVDAERFAELAGATGSDEEPSGVKARLAEALSLWRGPVLDGLDSGALRADVNRLEELRIAVVERRIEVDLALGGHAQLVSELDRLVASYPLRESLRAQLMVALYRSGRQGDALAVYRQTREILADELGIDPSPALQDLEVAILNQAPELNAPVEGARTAVGTGPPSGTVTLLFSDIEGSTRLWEQEPDAMASALKRHDEILRSAIEGSGGYVFKTVGDAFCATFRSAKEAVRAAAVAQRALFAEPWPEEAVLRVRMALHTGECEERDGDYVGPPVNRVARLQATTHAGQVVMSRVTTDLVRELPEGVALRDLGEHWLKDLGQPERVFQIDVDGLQCDFPPLNSLTNPAVRQNLPAQASNFVGREQELVDLRTMLRGSRMVTLTGAGGSGKTRLALELAAERVVDGSGDGVWLVELAALTDAGFVASEVARVLGIVEEPGRPVTETLIDALRDRSLLVVLDNCEHLIDGSAKLADRLLRACPRVRILATSQEPLRIDGESLYRVPSLSLTSSGAATADEAGECEAVQLFVDRAATSDPAFALTEANARHLLAVCRRLDGIPLAIELAAARLRSMSLVAIEERLDDRFRLLTKGSRTALPRHQTLGAMVDWSYDLLNAFEQAVLRRLSVFVGSWNLDAAVAVCDDDLESWEVLDLLDSLIDKSLVQAESAQGEPRYRMLETVRLYAAEQLRGAGQAENTSARCAHAKVFLELAETAARNLHGAQQGEWLARLEADHDNLRAAFTHYLNDYDGAEEALRLGRALRWFWFIRGFFDEGTEFAEAALAHMRAQQPTELRVSVLAAAGDLHNVRGEYAEAQSRLEEGLALARSIDLPAIGADLLCTLSSIHRVKGQYRLCGEMADEAVALARDSNDGYVLARALMHRAYHRTDTSDAGQVRGDLEEALSCFMREGDQRSIATTFAQLGVVELRAGNANGAKEHLLGALDIASQLHDNDEVPRILLNLGFAAMLQADLVDADNAIKGALRIVARTGASHWIAYSLLGLAFCASFTGEDHRAAVLHGASDALIEKTGEVHEQIGIELRDHDHSRLRGAMGEDFEVAYTSGRRLAQNEAVAMALDG